MDNDISPAQCRAARALRRWTRAELASKARVSERAIQDFEAEKRDPTPATRMALRYALELAGVDFVGAGVSPNLTTQLRGITPDPRKAGHVDEIDTD